MNKCVRDIKIDRIQGNLNPIYDLFMEIWNDLSIINVDVYNKDGGEFIYYNSKNEWIFYQDIETNKFWFSFDTYIPIFQSKFSMGYDDIKSITKYLVEDVLRNKIGMPSTEPNISGKVLQYDLENKIKYDGVKSVMIRDAIISPKVAPNNKINPSSDLLKSKLEDSLQNSYTDTINEKH